MKVLLVLALSLMSASAMSKNLWCTGSIYNSYITGDGRVVINTSWRNGWTTVCKTDGSLDNISVVTCSLWVGLISTAISNDKPVTIMYSNVPESLECDALATYDSAPVPAYVMLKSK